MYKPVITFDHCGPTANDSHIFSKLEENDYVYKLLFLSWEVNNWKQLVLLANRTEKKEKLCPVNYIAFISDNIIAFIPSICSNENRL